MKILIIGDSFAADWSLKYSDYPGWPKLLSCDYSVTNLAQAGVSEYKIWLQVDSVANLSEYDLVIVSHTSPYRIHTPTHPVHHNDPLHKHADLMLADCEYHASRIKFWFNSALSSAVGFYRYHFDKKYFETLYIMFRERINQKLSNHNVIVINNLPGNIDFATEPVVLDFSKLWEQEPGLINHYSDTGNQTIYQKIKHTIEIMTLGSKKNNE
jgi:hypothetical protein